MGIVQKWRRKQAAKQVRANRKEYRISESYPILRQIRAQARSELSEARNLSRSVHRQFRRGEEYDWQKVLEFGIKQAHGDKWMDNAADLKEHLHNLQRNMRIAAYKKWKIKPRKKREN